MRKIFAPAILVASLALASTAFAATAPVATPAAPAAKPAATAAAAHNKREVCEKTWSAQKTHTGTRDAFLKACVAKG